MLEEKVKELIVRLLDVLTTVTKKKKKIVGEQFIGRGKKSDNNDLLHSSFVFSIFFSKY